MNSLMGSWGSAWPGLNVSRVLFNSKHDQCRACFVFHCLLLIWSSTPEKILKLLHIVVKLEFIDLFFDLPLLLHMKTEIMLSVSVWFLAGWGRNDWIWRWKIVIWNRRQSGAGGSSDFVWVNIMVFFLERILLYNKLKNTCQSFHGESSTGCTQAIQLYYTIVNEPSVKQQKALKI